MLFLLAVSILWGFSFGLIKAEFSDLSGSTLAFSRLLIALPCFLPFITKRFLRVDSVTLQYLAIGAIQYGWMYLALFNAFRWLNGYEVALLTIFTPLYVILAHALLTRNWPPAWFWWTALLAVLGALWIFRPDSLPEKGPGIVLMQFSNLCFAFGQVAWRKLRMGLSEVRDLDGYALLFLGGVLAILPFTLFSGSLAELASLSLSQWSSLLYLGAIASGLGFFLWNAGATRVQPATLAVFNNLKIPVAILISITVFREQPDYATLLPGMGVLLLALAWAEWARQKSPTRDS